MPDCIQVAEPMELKHMKPVYFKCKRGDYCHFYFRIEQPTIVKINTWPLDKKSEPDLYVGFDEDIVDFNNYVLKSNKIGAD